MLVSSGLLQLDISYSVAISKSLWFLISRLGGSPFILSTELMLWLMCRKVDEVLNEHKERATQVVVRSGSCQLYKFFQQAAQDVKLVGSILVQPSAFGSST